MFLERLASPDGEIVVTSANGVEALRALGYTDVEPEGAKAKKAKAAKPDVEPEG